MIKLIMLAYCLVIFTACKEVTITPTPTPTETVIIEEDVKVIEYTIPKRTKLNTAIHTKITSSTNETPVYVMDIIENDGSVSKSISTDGNTYYANILEDVVFEEYTNELFSKEELKCIISNKYYDLLLTNSIPLSAGKMGLDSIVAKDFIEVLLGVSNTIVFDTSAMITETDSITIKYKDTKSGKVTTVLITEISDEYNNTTLASEVRKVE